MNRLDKSLHVISKVAYYVVVLQMNYKSVRALVQIPFEINNHSVNRPLQYLQECVSAHLSHLERGWDSAGES